jgi:hypothetical protein
LSASYTVVSGTINLQNGGQGGGGQGGDGSAMSGLGTVRQGASDIGSALGRASEAIGGGGGGGPRPMNPAYMKKGGKVTTTRMSTSTRSKKSPNW